jgi:hypothetical protein
MPAIPYDYETHISLAIVINYQTTCSSLTATQLTVYSIYPKGN